MGYNKDLIFPNEARDALVRKAVRTSIIDPNAAPAKDGDNGGSGILVASRRKHYVLTAYHCIKEYAKEVILVQWKDEKGNFHKIGVRGIVSKDEKEDWAILEVGVTKKRHTIWKYPLGSRGCDIQESTIRICGLSRLRKKRTSF